MGSPGWRVEQPWRATGASTARPGSAHRPESQTLARLDDLAIETTPDLHGIKWLLNQSLVVQTRLNTLKREVEELGHQRTAMTQPIRDGRVVVAVPPRLLTLQELEELISRLETVNVQLARLSKIDVTFEVSSDR